MFADSSARRAYCVVGEAVRSPVRGADVHTIEDHPEDASVSGSQHPDRVLSGIPAGATMAKHEDHTFHLAREYPDIAHPDVAHTEHRGRIDHNVGKSIAERRYDAGESL